MTQQRIMGPEEITSNVVASFEGCEDERLRQITQSLVRHLHAFAIEVCLRWEEWEVGINLLADAGRITDERRNEFILGSDTLGLSMMVDAIANPKPAGATESTVVGPFHLGGSPERHYGASMLEQAEHGVPTWYEGRVLSTDGTPVSGAELDVWQNDDDRLYAVQDPGKPEYHLRGRFRSLEDGRYAFLGVRPTPYTIPSDGPVGAMLRAAGRHNWRPAHIHMIVSACGYEVLATHIFDRESDWLESDAVFAVKPSLLRDFVEHEPDHPATPAGVATAWCSCACDIVLVPVDRECQRSSGSPASHRAPLA
jgi:hydroxyquinol 1,2-dioxygenase